MRQNGLTTHRRGFTLIELIIVILILGVLGALVIPYYSRGADQAIESTLSSSVRTIRQMIEHQHAKNGAYPATIEASWFGGGKVPKHPDNKASIATIDVDSQPGQTHPAEKVLTGSVGGAYWYNPANGQFHARVTDQGSEAATLKSYNLVNGAKETSLGNY